MVSVYRLVGKAQAVPGQGGNGGLGFMVFAHLHSYTIQTSQPYLLMSRCY